jgi:hypothetical protein
MPRIHKIKLPRGSTVPTAGTGSTNLDVYELGYRTGTTELYINDNGTIRQVGGGPKKITHNWAIDGTISTGDLPPMILRCPAKIVGIHGVYRTGSGTVTTTLYYGSSGEGDELGLTSHNTTTLKAIASATHDISLTGTGIKYIRPVITAAGSGVADYTISIEIEY